MPAMLRSLKTAEVPHYGGNVMKGFVTGLNLNNIGLYLFDIVYVRGATHALIPSLTGVFERQVFVPGKDDGEYGALNIRFESIINAAAEEPFKVEMRAYDFLPSRHLLESVADGLWQVVNQSLAIEADFMLSTVSLDENNEPERSWARAIDKNGAIVPTSYKQLVQMIEDRAITQPVRNLSTN